MPLLDRLLRALGVNPVQLRWRLHRLRERTRRRARSLENRGRALSYRHQVCPECGLTADRGERACPRCGARLHGPWARRLVLLWRTLVPAGTYTYTVLFVTANVALYAAMVMQPDAMPSEMDLLSRFGAGIPASVMDRFGAWTVGHIARGELWRLVTPCFLHFGLLHLIFNCLWLVQLGPVLEQHHGRARYLVLYLGGGVAGMALSVGYRYLARGPHAPDIGAGASGVVFGFIGAALVQGYLKKSPGSEVFRGGLGKWALYAIIFSLLPGVDLVAHLGGGLAGAGLGAVLPQGSRQGALWGAVELLCLGLVVGSFVVVARGG